MTNCAVIQERQSSTSATVASIALAYSSAITAGSFKHSAPISPGGTTFTMTDDVDGSHGAALDPISPGAAAFAQFVKGPATAGATTQTAGFTPSQPFVGIWIKEIGPTSGLDVHTSQLQTSGTTRSSGNSTPSTEPGLVSSFGYNDTHDNSMSPDTGSGFTAGAASPGWDFGFPGFSTSGSESLRYTSTAPIASTYTGAITADATGVVQALFIEAGAAALGGGSTSASSAAGALSTAIKLAGTLASTVAASGTLSGSTPAALAGGAISGLAAAGALSTAIKFAATPSDPSSATADLDRMVAAAISSSSSVGALTTAIILAGAPVSALTANGTLFGSIVLAAAASSATSAAAALTNWTTVTLAAPLNLGLGSILDPHFWQDSVPTVGTVVFYDATFIAIATDGSISSSSNNCQAVVQFFDGTNWALGVVFITSGLAAYGDMRSVAQGALTTAIRLVGAAASLVAAVGGLNAQIILLGAAQSVTSAAATLTGQILIAASAIDDSNASGTLTGTVGSLAGNAISIATATGFLNAQILLAAAATDLVSATGALAAHIQLAASAVTTTSASATLITGTQLAGAAASAAAATAALLTQIKVAGAAIDLVSATGALSAHITLLGAAVSSSVANGALSTNTGLAGAAASISSASGALTALVQMSAHAFSGLAAAGALGTGIPLAGSGSDTDTATGALTATGSAVGLYTEDPFFVIAHRRQYFTERFPEISPGDSVVLSFNCGDDLHGTEKLQGIAIVTVVASAGTDNNAAGHVFNGICAYDPTLELVEQPFHNGLPACDYYFTVTAPTTNPFKTITRYGLLSVRG